MKNRTMVEDETMMAVVYTNPERMMEIICPRLNLGPSTDWMM